MQPRHRRAFWIAIGVLCLSCWTASPWLGAIQPLVLGMPFSMFSLVAAIAIVFVTFLVVFVRDRKDDEKLDRLGR